MRVVALVIATAAALLAGSSGVAEAKGFRGTTSQKRMASLVTGEGGFVARIRIGYSARCSDPRYRFPNVLRFEPPFKVSTADRVRETVTLRERLTGGGRSRQTATVTARRVVDAAGVESWTGTFKTRAVLTKGGKRLDVCELKRVTWTATATS
jgi:hypothetical protein